VKAKYNLKLLNAIRVRGLFQADLVGERGLSCEARISRIIRGRVTPNESEIRILCKLLRATREELGW
jgi:hypothetical protein